jgi:hypothetical protein
VISTRLAAALLLATPVLGTAGRAPLLLDDFSRPDGRSALGTAWRAFTDQVMGGVSTQSVGRETVEGERALRLRGEVRLDNNGGFVQVALDLGGPRDASAFLRAGGNAERCESQSDQGSSVHPHSSSRDGCLRL